MNGNLKKYISDYYHINNSWAIPLKAGEDPKDQTSPSHLHLDESNNLFVDVETVQQSMVKLYEFTPEGMPTSLVRYFAPILLHLALLKLFVTADPNRVFEFGSN